MQPVIYNTMGTIGVLCILGTYFLLQTERLQADDIRYSLVNFIGSALVLFSLLFDFQFALVSH